MCCHTECHAADTGRDTPPRNNIQLQGRHVVVFFIDVECLTGIRNYPFECLGLYPTEKSFPDLPHTPANAQLYDTLTVVLSQRLGRKCTVPTESSPTATSHNFVLPALTQTKCLKYSYTLDLMESNF